MTRKPKWSEVESAAAKKAVDGVAKRGRGRKRTPKSYAKPIRNMEEYLKRYFPNRCLACNGTGRMFVEEEATINCTECDGTGKKQLVKLDTSREDKALGDFVARYDCASDIVFALEDSSSAFDQFWNLVAACRRARGGKETK